MVKLAGLFSRLGASKALVVGDYLVDAYTVGKARRISPEAPVAVVHVQSEENRAGGAGNVVLNLVSLGAEVVALGRVGNDWAGDFLCQALASEGVDVRGIVRQPNFPTPLKNRIIAENQQIVRIDHEKILPIEPALEDQIIQMLPTLLEGVKVVAISDYGKGMLSRHLLKVLIDGAKKREIPVIVDPKGIEFSKYAGATILKPNLGEAYSAAGLPSEASLEDVASKILPLSQAEVLMITRSESGISLFFKNQTRHDFPVRMREVKDVTGAGDTVLAMLACAIANGLNVDEAAHLSNLAAGIAIEKLGCARVSLPELARRLLEDDVVNKVFDEEHIFALQQALFGHPFTLLSLSLTKGLTPQIFQSIKKITQKDKRDLLLYIRDKDPSEEYINVLASLHEVNFILLKGDSLKELCQITKPNEVYTLDENLVQLQDASSLL
jgi:rfaE bifunctional protein kinase chain/domain